MQFFRRFFGRSSSSRPALPIRHRSRSSSVRLTLEALEDRTLLNNRLVVPVGIPVDNVNTFTTLKAALTTPGLTSGDFIQIEPGSVPGNVGQTDFNAAYSSAISLTIQGDPAFGVSATPQFTISDATTIAPTLNLKNVNLGLIAAGSLTFNGNATISSSILADVNSTAAVPFTFGGSTDVLTNSTLVSNVTVSELLEVRTPGGGSSNVISGNSFVLNATSTNALVAYNTGAGVAVTDTVLNNAFIANAGTSLTSMLLVNEPITGLTIQNNTFSGSAGRAIGAVGAVQNLRIVRNSINLSGTGSLVGINIVSGSTTTGAIVSENVVNAGVNGTGLLISVGAGALNLAIQGNDFHGSKIGVEVDAAGNSIAGIDLGGGTQGSLGGNNFRSFTAAATSSSGAIVINATTGTIQAQRNIFAVANPQTVISATGGATVNATALTANAAFVQTLYNLFLKRPGDTTNPNDAGTWVNALNNNQLTRAQVANALARSSEGLGLMVDAFYFKYLGRAADAGGRAGFVSFLQNGGTQEQVIVSLVTSGEYLSLFPSDTSYVQSLYVKLLNRAGDSAGLTGWVSGVESGIGRAAVVNAFVFSPEYRAIVVTQDYQQLLHRAPDSGLSGWVFSGVDLLSIAITFASTPEFFSKG